MQASEFRAAIQALGMSQRQAAAYLRVTEGTVSRWAHGVTAVPGPICKLIEIALVDIAKGAPDAQ